jgi:hypothetical protein
VKRRVPPSDRPAESGAGSGGSKPAPAESK